MRLALEIPSLVLADVNRAYKDAGVITVLGYADVIPRLYARVAGHDSEVVVDWSVIYVHHRFAFAALVALGGAHKLVPSLDISEETRTKDWWLYSHLLADQYKILLNEWAH